MTSKVLLMLLANIHLMLYQPILQYAKYQDVTNKKEIKDPACPEFFWGEGGPAHGFRAGREEFTVA